MRSPFFFQNIGGFVVGDGRFCDSIINPDFVITVHMDADAVATASLVRDGADSVVGIAYNQVFPAEIRVVTV